MGIRPYRTRERKTAHRWLGLSILDAFDEADVEAFHILDAGRYCFIGPQNHRRFGFANAREDIKNRVPLVVMANDESNSVVLSRFISKNDIKFYLLAFEGLVVEVAARGIHA